MSLIKPRRTASPLSTFFSPSVRSLFQDFFDDFDDNLVATRFIQGDNFPKLDIYQEGDNLVVKAAVAGLNKDDVKAEINNGILSISYNKSAEKSEGNKEERDYFFKEIKTSSFERRVRLRDDVDVEKSTADYADGVLTINLPLKEEAKPKVKQLTF